MVEAALMCLDDEIRVARDGVGTAATRSAETERSADDSSRRSRGDGEAAEAAGRVARRIMLLRRILVAAVALLLLLVELDLGLSI